MSEIFKKPYNVNLPKSAHAESEFGPGKKGLIMCKSCGAVYFKKHWHENIEALNKSENSAFEKDTPVKFELCPACRLLENKQYEGRVTIVNVPDKHAVELEGMIRHFCDRATDRDPMDKLIDIKKKGMIWEVWLTENELANKLAKKIKDVFNKVDVETRFAPEPSDAAEAVVEFKTL